MFEWKTCKTGQRGGGVGSSVSLSKGARSAARVQAILDRRLNQQNGRGTKEYFAPIYIEGVYICTSRDWDYG